MKNAEKSGAAEKLLSLIMYLLPLAFLIITYLFMTVAAEDVYQGAGTGTGYLQGAINAFGYDSRLSDMYAWAVIKAFDYQYSFGFDTIFRLIDVAAGYAIIYLISYTALGKRLRLSVRDASVFAAAFIFVYLNKENSSLYVAFSNIHNYLFIGLFTLLFILPFSRKLLGRTLPDVRWFRWAMLLLGFIFGFSSNITPAAFMAALIVVCGYIIIAKKSFSIKNVLKSWEFTAVLGVLIACGVMYGFGRGVEVYTISSSYAAMTGYVSFKTMLAAPIFAAEELLGHLADNIKYMLPLLLLIAFSLGSELLLAKKKMKKNFGGARLEAACLIFIVFHILAMTQIVIIGSSRLIMPAYFVCLAAILYGAVNLADAIVLKRWFKNVFALLLCVVMLSAVCDMGLFRYEYNNQIAPVLERIKNSDAEVVKIKKSELNVPESKIYSYTQLPVIDDWTVEAPVYGKTVEIVYD